MGGKLMHFWSWLAFVGGFIVLEILTLSLVFLSLAVAALAGAIGAALWSETYLQWIFFGITALLTLFVVRPLARRYLFKKSADSQTGMDALISAPALTITLVNSSAGRIRLRDEIWSARTDSQEIPAGSEVTVVRIDGAVAIVLPKLSLSNDQGE